MWRERSLVLVAGRERRAPPGRASAWAHDGPARRRAFTPLPPAGDLRGSAQGDDAHREPVDREQVLGAREGPLAEDEGRRSRDQQGDREAESTRCIGRG